MAIAARILEVHRCPVTMGALRLCAGVVEFRDCRPRAAHACEHPDDRRSHLAHRRRTFPNRRVSAGSADSVERVSARSNFWRQRASHRGRERVSETSLAGHFTATPPTEAHRNPINHDTQYEPISIIADINSPQVRYAPTRGMINFVYFAANFFFLQETSHLFI